jgi:UDP-2,3-diacylglucosamine pyrophosphatase LpxH
LLGNHDPGLLWEGVQETLREALGGEVLFLMESYYHDGIYIEHGNQYLADNRYDRSNYFLTKDLPEPIINLPFGSFLVVHYLNEIKKERSYVDKVYPFGLYLKWALIHDTWFAVRGLFKLTVWFFKFILTPNPARKITFPQVINILKETTLHPKLHKEAKRILFSRKDCRIVVFGHTHQYLHRSFAPGKDYFNTGTWNEKISLEVGSLGRLVKLTFVQIDYDKQGIPHGALKEWKGHTDLVEDVIY